MVVIGVMVGGALGALARLGVSVLTRTWLPLSGGMSFPVGTLVVNVVGSFLLALLAVFASRGAVSPQVATALGTGFLGAFTTLSTLALEAEELARAGWSGWATLFVAGNLVLGYLAIVAGRTLAERLAG